VTEPDEQQWFASCPKGIESLLATELSTLGASSTRETVAGVYFEGPLELAYRACMWSRLANRILLPVVTAEVQGADSLYRELHQVNWGQWFEISQTFAIDFSGQNQEIRNTQFGAQRSKDAIVDWFVEKSGARPSVDKRSPDLRFNIRLAKSRMVVTMDFSGGSLHRRGYRLKAGEAPLKENLAAALLLRADWPAMAARGGALIDPMCGSATLLLEGAMMAADIAPGLNRQRFGFENWKGHRQHLWQEVVAQAQERAKIGRATRLPEIRGYDADPKVVRLAQDNIARIQLQKAVRVSCKSLADLTRPSHLPLPIGLLICNPPYGERLGEKESLLYLYRELGALMMREFRGWSAAVFTSDTDLGKATGLRSHKRYALFNGAIASSLLLFDLEKNELRAPALPRDNDDSHLSEISQGAQMFANRLRKNRKRLSRWLNKEQIGCYRIYDADMPEYAVAVDVYGDNVHVAEYQAPGSISEEAAGRRFKEVVSALPDALGVPPHAIAYKQRRRQRGSRQYEKEDDRGELISVTEGPARLLVNLWDYLDTGLFLDHRPLRMRIAREARDKDFLNLYCYTGAATVHAALGGARRTTSIDLSNTYLGWLRKNLAHNGLAEATNELVRADCVPWLQQVEQQYDLILLDPPSFSNSKRMDGSFDVQRDHGQLIRAAMATLKPGGQMYFSNNRRGFELDQDLRESFNCIDISGETLDPDFQRNPKIHCCWVLTQGSGAAGIKQPKEPVKV
jgi:23S rRNA (guanine2445-N2)-methyltransferase / 23S rRNA (guanine2069-N7)-methyltransferase